jgi:maltose O-acetyltransferase
MFRPLGRILATLVPDSFWLGWDWKTGEKRAGRLRVSLRRCGQCVSIGQSVVIRSPGEVSIGDDCHINDFVHVLGAGGVEIGSRVYVANHASIISLTHPADAGSIAAEPCLARPVTIEDDVWIGAHAVILPGVRLGESCVVGAGSVVTKDVPAHAIVAGVPARLLRMKTAARNG